MKRAIRIATAILVAQLVSHVLQGCATDEAIPPDAAPLPLCADLGCAFALCSSHDGPCTCNGEACAPRVAVDAETTNFAPSSGSQKAGVPRPLPE